MEDRKVYHTIFTWHLENFCFCNRQKSSSLDSPSFRVGDTSWHLSISLSCKGKIWFVFLKETSKNISGAYCVKYKCTCSDTTGVVWHHKQKRYHFKKGKDEDCIVIPSDNLFLNFQANFSFWNSQTIVCEMICCEIEKNNTKNSALETISKPADIHQLSDDMRNIFLSKQLTDVTISVKCGTISAHKAILCARSSIFEKMFKQDPSKRTIELPHIEYDIMKLIISFLYSADFRDLFKDGPPPIGLYECAKEFAITELEVFLRPQEIHARTEIRAEEGEYTWRIKNFCSLTQKHGEYIESDVFQLTSCCGIDLNLRLYPSGDIFSEDYVGIFIEGLGKYKKDVNSSLQILMRVSLIDESGEFSHTRQCVKSLQETNICGFDSFICREILLDKTSTLLSRGVLIVHCYLKLSLGDYKSEIRKISHISGIENERLDCLSCDLKRLYYDKTFCDSTLIAEGVTFPVHRVVLSARSPVFAGMFRHNMKEKETGEVVIFDIKTGVLSLLLEYIYCGYVCKMAPDTALGLYCAAEKYAISHLKERCSDFLKINLEIHNAGDILFTANLHSDRALKSSALDFICRNADLIFSSKSWEVLVSQDSNLVLEVMKILTESYLCQKNSSVRAKSL